MTKLKDFYIWEGVYSDFAEAENSAVGKGFSGSTYLKSAKKAAKDSLAMINKGKQIPKFYKQRFTSYPAMVSIAMKSFRISRKFKVLDFGGGLGVGYLNLQECIPKTRSSILYKIVEVPEVVAHGKKFYKNLNLPVSFSENIPRSKYDFVFCGSVIQYIKNWKQQLIELSKTNPDYILLGDVFCGNIQSFASLQNYYESKIPHWFLSQQEIEEVLVSIGYELIHQDAATGIRAGHEDDLPMMNFKKKYRLRNTVHLLFKKKAK